MLMLIRPDSLGAITSKVNRSIITSTFAKQRKQPQYKPLPKSTSTSTFEDLRPISILPCFSIILEKSSLPATYWLFRGQ